MSLASVSLHVFSVHAGCLQRGTKERSMKGRDMSVKCAGANTLMPERSKWCHGAAVFKRPVVFVRKQSTLYYFGVQGKEQKARKGDIKTIWRARSEAAQKRKRGRKGMLGCEQGPVNPCASSICRRQHSTFCLIIKLPFECSFLLKDFLRSGRAEHLPGNGARAAWWFHIC